MILLIDSDERSRRLTELSLRKAGHPVSGVASLAAAAASLRSAPPSLILTEARLSDGSALTLLAQLKAEGRNLPVIIVSDGSDASLPAAAQAAGAADVVARPLQIRELVARITDILARATSLAGGEAFSAPRMVAWSRSHQPSTSHSFGCDGHWKRHRLSRCFVNGFVQ
jgi:DNA-binding response OmpR family regulator